MGVKERRERERLEMRERILDAARTLFTKHGYDAVTMRAIAEAIEYSPAALYFHFADKDALLAELCAGDFARFTAEFAPLLAVEDPIERLVAMALVYTRFAREQPQMYRFMFMTQRPLRVLPDNIHKHGDPTHDVYALLHATIVDAIGKRLFLPKFKDAHLIAQLLWGGLHGVISLRMQMEDKPFVDWRATEDVVAQQLELMMTGLAGDDELMGRIRRTGKKVLRAAQESGIA
jgi:AcrR family transcriptional regulator